MQHLTDDALEQYVLQLTSEPETDAIEEHLLTCEACRTSLQEIEEYIAAMRGAAGRLRSSEPVPTR